MTLNNPVSRMYMAARLVHFGAPVFVSLLEGKWKAANLVYRYCLQMAKAETSKMTSVHSHNMYWAAFAVDSGCYPKQIDLQSVEAQEGHRFEKTEVDLFARTLNPRLKHFEPGAFLAETNRQMSGHDAHSFAG